MKLLVVGASGTIGQAVVKTLELNHEVLKASRSAQHSVDITDPVSIRSLYDSVAPLDGILSVAGTGKFGPLASLDDDDYNAGLGNKLMGQINLVRHGIGALNPGGSLTLTSGILASHPNPNSVLITTLNAAIEGFVRAASLDLPKGTRLNVISPPMVKETAIKLGWGEGGVTAAEVSKLYADAVEGSMNGDVITYHASAKSMFV